MNRFFAPGGEFALIERMFAADHFARDGRGLGDDAFVWELPGAARPWLVTSDVSAEGVHYRLDWASPERALRKALAANLSDINAMGGRSRKAFFNLGARRDWSDSVYDALGAALRAMEEAFGFTVAGGDTVKLPDSSFFSFTVMGEAEGRPLLRSACRPGHRIYVSGSLGGSAAGLHLLRTRDPLAQAGAEEHLLVRAHLDPRPPLALGPLLAALGGEIAAIDISDGLSSELAHLARQSGRALRVDAEKLPAHPALAARPSLFSAAAARDFVLHGGEEYQLLFTGNFTDVELARLQSVTSVTEIGEVREGEGVTLREGGEERLLEAKGWSHGESR
jgi:thiamine-monophosphate kinase